MEWFWRGNSRDVSVADWLAGTEQVFGRGSPAGPNRTLACLDELGTIGPPRPIIGREIVAVPA